LGRSRRMFRRHSGESALIAAMKIAIQGERGSFSHQASMKMVPGSTVVPCAVSADVFDRLDRGQVQAAVIPIENSLAGSVAEHFDLLLARDAFVHAEFRLRIELNLMAAPGVRLRDLRKALSHPVALAQCRDFFRKHRHIAPEPFYDTAGSVKHVTERKLRDAGGIAGRQAAAEYGARILARGIEDDKQNFTRFFLVSRRRRVVPRANKTSIAFALKNQPGVLFKALSVFALRDISLSKIESRPVRGRPWEYIFFADFLRGSDRVAQNALHQLGEFADMVKVLGVYRAA
jgi:prephenate dehydratase